MGKIKGNVGTETSVKFTKADTIVGKKVNLQYKPAEKHGEHGTTE